MKNDQLAHVLQAIHDALADLNDRLQDAEIALDKSYGGISTELDTIKDAVTTLEAQYYD